MRYGVLAGLDGLLTIASHHPRASRLEGTKMRATARGRPGWNFGSPSVEILDSGFYLVPYQRLIGTLLVGATPDTSLLPFGTKWACFRTWRCRHVDSRAEARAVITVGAGGGDAGCGLGKSYRGTQLPAGKHCGMWYVVWSDDGYGLCGLVVLSVAFGQGEEEWQTG